MNDGQYPRNIVPMGFDLMAGHRNRGDRSRREEDRYLFLEALVSAQDKLYISYIGRDINDNSEQIPSVLLSELLSYCQQSYVLAENINDSSVIAEKALGQFIEHRYPMQSYSDSYYQGEVTTYNQNWWQASALAQSKEAHLTELSDSLLPLDEPLLEIQLAQLKQFFKHPCKAFYNQRLDVYFELDESEDEDDEPFSLNHLQQYQLKKRQFDSALEGRSLEELFFEIKATGELPIAEFAPLIFNKDLQSMVDLADLTSGYFIGEIETINIDINFSEKRLLGELSDHCVNGLVRVKTGNVKGKDILVLWLDHLCYCIAHGKTLNSSLFGQNSGIYFEELTADYAYQKLHDLIAVYERGLQGPLAFFVQSAFAWSCIVHSQQPDCFILDDLSFATREQAQQAALETFANTRGFAEGSDPYINRHYENLEDHWLAFETYAMQIFKPILANISTIEYSEWLEQE